MPSVKDVLSVSAITLFAATNAHMILQNPLPYGTPNSSPLDPSGSNFPCKASSNAGGYVTEMPIGSTQQLSFKGSAVHGGGSCQVSLTTDNPATKKSKWMVIHSIEGGCPSKGATGNLGDNPNSVSSADKYDFKIPDGIKQGPYTLAWTWFNQIGNREMYMNCASIKVTGGSKKRDTYTNDTYAIPELNPRDTSFPDMFVANVPTSNCRTVEGASVKFPNPGASVDHFGKTGPPSGAQCSAGPAGVPSTGSPPESDAGTDPAAGGAGAGGSGAGGSGAGGSGAGGAGAGGSGAGGSGDGSPAGASSGQGAVAAGIGSGAGTQASNAGSQTDAAANASSEAGAAPAASSAAPPTGGNSSSGSSPSSAPAAPAAQGAPAAAAPAGTVCTEAGKSICSPDGKNIGKSFRSYESFTRMALADSEIIV